MIRDKRGSSIIPQDFPQKFSIHSISIFASCWSFSIIFILNFTIFSGELNLWKSLSMQGCSNITTFVPEVPGLMGWWKSENFGKSLRHTHIYNTVLGGPPPPVSTHCDASPILDFQNCQVYPPYFNKLLEGGPCLVTDQDVLPSYVHRAWIRHKGEETFTPWSAWCIMKSNNILGWSV